MSYSKENLLNSIYNHLGFFTNTFENLNMLLFFIEYAYISFANYLNLFFIIEISENAKI